jgi:thymidylate synthase
MKQYLDAVQRVLDHGQRLPNRTGIDTLAVHGHHFTFDMANGFPIVTTKKLNWRSAFAEMVGFLQCVQNASQFRSLGTKVWDANANENAQWLENPNRLGPDDLGRIYGAQWRDWRPPCGTRGTIDQLDRIYHDLSLGRDNRREIVTAWNPGELDQMALPPCHAFMQFGLMPNNKDETAQDLDLFVYLRSSDIGLGLPFNIAQYAFLLHLMAEITNNVANRLHVFCWNLHAYINHVDGLREQLTRSPLFLPTLQWNDPPKSLGDVESWIDTSHVDLINYQAYPTIKLPMAV